MSFLRKGEVLACVGRIHNLKGLKDLSKVTLRVSEGLPVCGPQLSPSSTTTVFTCQRESYDAEKERLLH